MKRTVSTLVLAGLLTLVGSASSAFASGNLLTQSEFESRSHRAECLAERVRRIHTYQKKLNKLKYGHNKWKPRGPSVQVPELSANVAGSALSLLLGGALVLSDRRRRAAR
jgi:hypothetical protein